MAAVRWLVAGMVTRLDGAGVARAKSAKNEFKKNQLVIIEQFDELKMRMKNELSPI